MVILIAMPELAKMCYEMPLAIVLNDVCLCEQRALSRQQIHLYSKEGLP
jgi:hypothetical protein